MTTLRHCLRQRLDRYTRLPNEEETEHVYYDTGAVFKLNANLSVTFDYSRGERAPWYVEEDAFSVMFGVEL